MNTLPNELLLKIFSYIPNNKSIALVSRRFYDAVCTLDAKHVRLVVHASAPKEKNEDYIRSIMNTTRTIRNILIGFELEERSVIIGVLKKFADNIDYLRVSARKRSDFLEAIELVPNVVNLELVSQIHLEDDDNVPPLKKARHENNGALNLLRLRKLQIERCAHLDVVEMFNRLPADLLTELTLDQDNLSQMSHMFQMQRNIKKLTITQQENHHEEAFIRDADLFDHMQLEFLEWHAGSFDHTNVCAVLAKQNNLQSLRLVSMEIGVDLLNVITDKLRQLRTLQMGVTYLPNDAFKSISKLVDLNDLTLWSDEENAEVFTEFAKLDNTRITALNIQHTFDIPPDVIAAMARSLPNLKMITIHCGFSMYTFSAILKHFNYVEAVHLDAADMDWEVKDRLGNCESLIKRGCNNDKLTELRISYPIAYSEKMIEKMVKFYPHLTRLVIFPTNRLLSAQLIAIVKGFKELESFFILRSLYAVKKRSYNLNIFTVHGLNLKFVALLDLELKDHDVSMITENVGRKFGFIEYDTKLGVKMAVGRETMKSEWEYVMKNTEWEHIRLY